MRNNRTLMNSGSFSNLSIKNMSRYNMVSHMPDSDNISQCSRVTNEIEEISILRKEIKRWKSELQNSKKYQVLSDTQ
jgi:hypothetical protein